MQNKSIFKMLGIKRSCKRSNNNFLGLQVILNFGFTISGSFEVFDSVEFDYCFFSFEKDFDCFNVEGIILLESLNMSTVISSPPPKIPESLMFVR